MRREMWTCPQCGERLEEQFAGSCWKCASDMFASVTDIVGGRSDSYEGKLRDAQQIALTKMALEAKSKGGNAIVGIDLDYESIRGTMLMVAVCGTAVVVEPEEASMKAEG